MPGKQQRRIVFFLGAGASYGAGAFTTVQHGGKIRVPTQATFWETLLRLSRSRGNRSDIELFFVLLFFGLRKGSGSV